MSRLPLLLAFLLLSLPALAGDKPTIIIPDAGNGTTIGKVNGETVILKKTPNGTVGKIGKDTVVIHTDTNGNSIGKVGQSKLFCHTDKASGMTICK